MAKAVTLIFDIGKTNKKLFLFDEKFEEVYSEVTRIKEVPDNEGFLSEDLNALTKWIKDSTSKILYDPSFEVKAINFSAYGASMVHLDENGKIIAPFYNYLKSFPENLKIKFFKKYNRKGKFPLTTGSPYMGFLNSGLQLYYLKYSKPEIFAKLHVSLHFPQYLSYIFTGKFKSEWTTLGCHSGLWDFRNNTYAYWVKEEGFEKFLAPIIATSKMYQTKVDNKVINIGIGVHDSSSTLIPYLQNTTNPFVLISTGTWSVCMNFFNELELTKTELENDCQNFLSINGKSIKVSRLFLGKEFIEQVEKLQAYFNCEDYQYESIPYNDKFISLSDNNNILKFKFFHLDPPRFGFEEPKVTVYEDFEDFDQAYHQLMHELAEIQIASLKLVLDGSIQDIFIDGGFTRNELFVQMLVKKLPEYNVVPRDIGIGSALGAAMLVNHNRLPHIVLKNKNQRI